MIYTHHEIVEMHGGLSRVERPSVQDHATYERKDQAPVCPHFLISLSLSMLKPILNFTYAMLEAINLSKAFIGEGSSETISRKVDY